MKKVMALVCALAVGLFAFVACGGDNADTSASASATARATTSAVVSPDADVSPDVSPAD